MAARIEQVRVERDGPVTTVVMSRPETRNAVDGRRRASSPPPSARSTPTRARASPSCGARAGRSAPAPT
ncbi:hypothetical protein [Actinomadura madurae]|uniref:hypothetical protein n=1 Tax=Actinomadura madurae TaxID=1993 RepID=UPI0020D20400|nr:hypothetical protein [Actinomadura madurae]MCP9969265.1 hypothetical protein [Actinomadura madurae]MCQ0006743.1 hypothetical protein [Actinomadura madurae]